MDIRGRKMRKPPACVQCRKRKIGCDRVKPICGNCSKTNKGDCFFPDVPGRYVPAHAKGPAKLLTPPQGGSSSRGDSLSSTLHHNPELASLEQLREYNTRLQLLNGSQDQTDSPMSTNFTQFLPRSIPNMDNKTVSSINDNSANLNWIQGPALFDEMPTPYTQEEVVMKEIDFLKSRLLELQDITGKKIPGLNLSWKDLSRKQNNNGTIDSIGNEKKRKLETEDNLHFDILYNTIDEFRDLDPQFLDFNQIFNVFDLNDSQFKSSIPMRDLPNSIFTSNFLISRDTFLKGFHNTFENIVTSKFEKNHQKWLENLENSPILQLTKHDEIKFPELSLIKHLITKYTSIVLESEALIPNLKPNELLQALDTLFVSNSFNPDSLSIEKLVTYGRLSILLLLTYNSLVSTVIVPLQPTELENVKALKDSLNDLKKNLYLIKIELQMRNTSKNYEDVIKFEALLKYYQTVTSIEMQTVGTSVDYDEDVHLSQHISLNHEQTNESLILFWNFIYREYCYRHLFKGEIPLLTQGQRSNSAPILDPILTVDYPLLNITSEIVRYLQTKDQLISLEKVLHLKDIFKLKYDEAQKKAGTLPTLIDGIVNSLLYRNTTLYLTYYLLLQYEKLKDSGRYFETYKEFLNFSQETLFFIFSNLANLRFAGYEFIYTNKAFVLVESLSEMLLSLIQRSFYAFDTNSEAIPLNESLRTETKNHSAALSLIVRKILMLLQDYSKNCREVNPYINRLFIRLTSMLEYISLLEATQNPENSGSGNESVKSIKAGLLGEVNAFEQLEQSDIARATARLQAISESLIKAVLLFYKTTIQSKQCSKLSV
ncbi:Rsc3p NDAI_0C04170 [Naumovozyma dairenensis CBS 421]|uniref:Zn(2)-C6 fungal-type domain-containing protein n=1 Tax=Naumovozyma dairenensis (strain ATCC 10597 / BCRC 20456 / CBS 421 / NBRC 0211 / NRRL Y-12639) TaxID=1071378 RepID=G0W8G6_NAUDC|nr:hypothetical protein NDAI_0C04170 [Naumovozyma dairenensis CBS 421]CCD24077.1 hypothetical protein NDAI_0C04170 [Naumovozyma dairenensis CBS 421]